MSTRYSVEIHKFDCTWESIALFADTVSVESMEAFITAEFKCGNSTSNHCDAIHVIDMETGELMASVDAAWALEDGAHIVNDEVVYPPSTWDDDSDDWGYNEDMGFDPYLGCYTDDC